MADCVFCKIIKNDEANRTVIFENDTIIAIKPKTEINPGNLKEKHTSTGVNLLHASGKDAGQSVFHFHMHIVPRFANDGLDLWLKKNL